jgi:hypothetical protein
MTTFIAINKKSIRIEVTGEEAKKQANRVRYAMKLADEREAKKEADIKRRGFCPNCHMLLPLTKYCYKCQTTYN